MVRTHGQQADVVVYMSKGLSGPINEIYTKIRVKIYVG
jgi:hypothetical protein